MDHRKALIAKLTQHLEGMQEVGISKEYTLQSPEVQTVPMFGLQLNIGEARLIRDCLKTYDEQRNETARPGGIDG